jgi:XTP/dITP diphosphohydrolase
MHEMPLFASSKLLVATHNAGKLREFQTYLKDVPLRLLSLSDLGAEKAEVEEIGLTFAENAALKARAYAKRARLWTLADDSGLEVEALGGAPGVLSARYAGAGASDEARIALLLDELARTRDEARRARFVCVLALADAEANLIKIFTGTCAGRIASAPCGMNGFGYDPVFVPDGYKETFGELTPETKARISHRARALHELKSFLLNSLRA